MEEWFVGSTESLDAITEAVKADVGGPDEPKRRRANFGKKDAAVSCLSGTRWHRTAKELACWKEKRLGILEVQLWCG
jgi:hypothetical protein